MNLFNEGKSGRLAKFHIDGMPPSAAAAMRKKENWIVLGYYHANNADKILSAYGFFFGGTRGIAVVDDPTGEWDVQIQFAFNPYASQEDRIEAMQLWVTDKFEECDESIKEAERSRLSH